MDSDAPHTPQNLLTGLARLAAVLEARRVSYALIGGIAAGYRSRPRYEAS